jgi:hypothetical protein
MYLARVGLGQERGYIIRESVEREGRYVSRDLVHLGADPEEYIEYPGGNSFFIHQSVEDVLRAKGLTPGISELEDLFWPFVSPEIRHAQRGFVWKSRGKRRPRPLSFFETEYLRSRLHIVDKRRMNYLRLGVMDQSTLSFSSLLKLYRPLLYMSRDEIEQYFLRQEAELQVREYSGYVFSFLNLRRHFSEIYAGVMPQALDQEQLDSCFVQDICALSRDETFLEENPPTDGLHPYLVRYAVMYFDYSFSEAPASEHLNRLRQDFFARKREDFARASEKDKGPELDRADRLFGVSEAELKQMERRELIRLYRQKAKEMHPDRGGNQSDFIHLTRIYKALLKRHKPSTQR